jgi:phosphatidylglycerol:prolipoprotein diacylglycerol transferase
VHPVLFSIDGVTVHGYGVMGAIGFLVVCGISLWRATVAGWSRDKVADVIFWTSLAGLVGSRLLYIALMPGQFATFGDWINLRTGGLVFYGALLAGIPVGFGTARRHGLPLRQLADVFGTALPFGHAISRVGCFMAGCCFGGPTDLPWGVIYSDPLAPGPHGVATHPTQLYEAAYLAAIGAFCSWLYGRRRFDGQVMLTYLLLYAICRSFNETLRGDATRRFVLEAALGQWVSTSQAISAAIVIAVVVVTAVAMRVEPPRADPPPTPADPPSP